MKSGTHHRRLDTWKKHDFVDIPEEVTKLTKDVKVQEDTVEIVMDNTVIGTTHFLCETHWLKYRPDDSTALASKLR